MSIPSEYLALDGVLEHFGLCLLAVLVDEHDERVVLGARIRLVHGHHVDLVLASTSTLAACTCEWRFVGGARIVSAAAAAAATCCCAHFEVAHELLVVLAQREPLLALERVGAAGAHVDHTHVLEVPVGVADERARVVVAYAHFGQLAQAQHALEHEEVYAVALELVQIRLRVLQLELARVAKLAEHILQVREKYNFHSTKISFETNYFRFNLRATVPRQI